MEDYNLRIRLLLDGAKLPNIPEVVLRVRGGERMYQRRGGLEYAREELRTQREMYRRDFTSLPIYVWNSLTGTTLRLLPNRVRGYIYQALTGE